MRSGVLGGLIGLSVAGAVFGSFIQGSLKRAELSAYQLPSSSVMTESEPQEFRTAVAIPVEPNRLPTLRFDEPPLANQKIIQASFTEPVSEGMELAPPPRREGAFGRMPLQLPDDAF